MTTKTAIKNMVDSFGRSQQENRDRLALMEKANEEARANWNNPQWRRDFAADLTESILLGFEYETLVGQWIDTETTDFNGRIFVKEAKGLKAFYMARGGYIEASELTSEVAELPRDMIGVQVWDFSVARSPSLAAPVGVRRHRDAAKVSKPAILGEGELRRPHGAQRPLLDLDRSRTSPNRLRPFLARRPDNRSPRCELPAVRRAGPLRARTRSPLPHQGVRQPRASGAGDSSSQFRAQSTGRLGLAPSPSGEHLMSPWAPVRHAR